MSDTRAILLNEIRYAERLCLRTCRLYRRLHTVSVVIGIVAGSAVLSSIATNVPAWVGSVGAIVFAILGATMVAVRAPDKAAANEYDAKRYSQLRTAANGMDDGQLRAAIDRAHEGDAPEIEPLRDVAYNDVVIEVGRPDITIRLTARQKLLAALA